MRPHCDSRQARGQGTGSSHASLRAILYRAPYPIKGPTAGGSVHGGQGRSDSLKGKGNRDRAGPTRKFSQNSETNPQYAADRTPTNARYFPPF